MRTGRRNYAAGAITSRARITNEPWSLTGVDGRTPGGRRFRDLCKAFAGPNGGKRSEVERSLIRLGAAVTLRCEQLQSDIANGKPVDGDLIIRLSSTAKRILEAIGTTPMSPKRRADQDLHSYIARRDV